MCGIVGIVSRPPTRPTPTRAELLDGLDAALAARGDAGAVAAAARGSSTRRCAGCPASLALADHHELLTADHGPARPARRLRRRRRRRAGRRRARPRGAGAGQRRVDRPARRAVGHPPRPPAHGAGRRRPGRPRRRRRPRSAGTCRSSRRCRRSTAWRSAAATRPASTSSCGTTTSTSTIPPSSAALAERGRDPLFQTGAARFAGRALSVVYKAAAEIGELGDNTRVMREAIAADALLRLALSGARAQLAVLGHTRWASVGIISEPNAHPVNSDEVRAARAASVPPFIVGVLNGDVDNHADLRVAARAALPRADHDRRQGHPGARGPPPPVGQRRPVRRVPPHGVVVRGLRRHRGRRRRRAGPPVPGAQRQRPGRLHRPRRRPLRRGQRAVRRRRGDRALRPPRRRARRPGRHARRRRRRHRRRHPPAGLRRLRAAGRRDRRRRRRGHHPRHRPRRQPALPAQGDHRVARQPGQDAAGQDRRHRRPPAGRSSAGGRCPPRSPPAWPPARSPGSGSSARARPPSPGSRWPRSSTS